MGVQSFRIVIADRSELAGNLYRLLLGPLKTTLVIRKRFEEARPHFFRREGVGLAIFNSNIFGKKFPDICRHLTLDEPMREVPKIFLCKAVDMESLWREKLNGIPNTIIIIRPFHPVELLNIVRCVFEGGGR